VRALSNALEQDRLHHAYLFTGTRGVGKTTIARIFAKSLNCKNGITAEPCGVCDACREIDSGRFVDLIELDAASNTQVDSMRELLESALYAPTSGRFKVYIIDEVHMLSKSAFNAMLKTLEEPPAHVKFILATTDPQKIPVTVLSRCLQFNLKQLSPKLILDHLQHILAEEGIASEQGALALVARAAHGSMRDALSLMDQAIAFSAGKVDEATVRSMLGTIDRSYLFDLLDALLQRDGAAMLRIADEMNGRSVALDAALQELATLLHRIALAQTVPDAIPEDEPDRPRLLKLAGAVSPEEVQLFYQIAIHGRDEIDLAPDEYAGFTMSLLRMLAFMPEGAARPVVSRGATAAAPVASPRVEEPVAERALQPVERPAAPRQPVAMDGGLDWNDLLAQLNLQGMAQQLARNCTLDSIADGVIALNLPPQHKALLITRSAQDKLQATLAAHFGRDIRLNIAVGEVSVETPAERQERERQHRQVAAQRSLEEDEFVREAQAQLGAQLMTETIKPV